VPSRFRGSTLFHRHNRGDFRDLFADVAFDAVLEGHGAAGATVTGAVEADLDDTGRGDVDEFEISPVGLDGRADEVDHVLHPVADATGGGRAGKGDGDGHGFLGSSARYWTGA